MSNFATRVSVFTLHGPLVAEFGVSNAAFGALHTVFLVTFAPCALVWALAADRWRRKCVLGAGALIWSAGTLLCAMAPTWGTLLVARATVGIGEGACLSAGVALLGEWFEPGRRARAIGAFYAAMVTGAAAGYILGSVFCGLDDSIGGGLPQVLAVPWRLLLVLLSLPGFVVAAAVLRLRDSGRFNPSKRTSSLLSREAWREVTSLLRIPSFPRVLVAATLFLFGMAVVLVFGPTFVRESKGFAAGLVSGWELAAVGLVFVVGGGAGFLTATWLVDRLEPRRPNIATLLAGLGCLGFAPSLLICLLVSTRWAEWLSVVPTAFFGSWVGPLVAVSAEAVAPPKLRATAIGVLTLVTNVFGEAQGAWISGLIADKLGAEFSTSLFEAGPADAATLGAAAGSGELLPALLIVPVISVVAGVAFLLASRTAGRDVAAARALERD